MVKHIKEKKELIINVWKVFHMLLESCQKVELRLIMIELAENFEKETSELKRHEKQQSDLFEQKIKVLRSEIKDREE
jgi:hypothetical protein